MKKSLTILAVAIAMFTISCGPSAEDKAKRDKAVADSIANEEAMMMELEAQKAQAIQDSLATIEKMKTDSIAADSVAKAGTKKK
jgi:protein involved in sex pheromone biosynthesis